MHITKNTGHFQGVADVWFTTFPVLPFMCRGAELIGAAYLFNLIGGEVTTYPFLEFGNSRHNGKYNPSCGKKGKTRPTLACGSRGRQRFREWRGRVCGYRSERILIRQLCRVYRLEFDIFYIRLKPGFAEGFDVFIRYNSRGDFPQSYHRGLV